MVIDKGKKQPAETSGTKKAPPIVAIVGNSGSGKTTLMENLIPEIVRRGFKVGTIKHDVHGFDLDKPGKDSWRHKKAGAATTVISSRRQIGLVMDVDADHSPLELLHLFRDMDIVLAEGYKRGKTPKLEVFRPAISAQPICKDDRRLLAVISDADVDLDVPRFSAHDVLQVADFLIDHFNLTPLKKTENS